MGERYKAMVKTHNPAHRENTTEFCNRIGGTPVTDGPSRQIASTEIKSLRQPGHKEPSRPELFGPSLRRDLNSQFNGNSAIADVFSTKMERLLAHVRRTQCRRVAPDAMRALPMSLK
jgi:hypothetical protein